MVCKSFRAGPCRFARLAEERADRQLKYARGCATSAVRALADVTGDLPIPGKPSTYDLWSGPAPLVPPHRSKIHYDWHWFWNYGNGDLGNQGIHQMDIARRFTGETALSLRCVHRRTAWVQGRGRDRRIPKSFPRLRRRR